MTRQFSSLLLILLFIFPSFAGNEISAQMLVGSYNIRYQNKEDNERGNSWKQRCPVICDQVNFLAPDIFGAQEVLHPQLLDLLQGLDGYDYIGVGRDDGKTEGEYAAIFYKKDHIRLLDNGNFCADQNVDQEIHISKDVFNAKAVFPIYNSWTVLTYKAVTNTSETNGHEILTNNRFCRDLKMYSVHLITLLDLSCKFLRADFSQLFTVTMLAFMTMFKVPSSLSIISRQAGSKNFLRLMMPNFGLTNAL